MSHIGTKRTSRPGLTMSVHRGRADSPRMALHFRVLTQSGNYRNMSTPHFALIDADDHRIWTDQWFNSGFEKARLPKPTHHLTFGKRGASTGVPVAASTADLSRGAVWHGVGFGSRMELAEKSPSSPRKRGQRGDFI